MKKEEVLQELKLLSKNLKHSIKKRECPYGLFINCVSNFGSFNKAKENAGLVIHNNRIINFKKEAFVKDEDLAKIVSYITFDGHIYDSLKAFYFSSKNVKDLNDFERLIVNKFGVIGKYYLNNGGGGTAKTHKYIVFNKKLSQMLFDFGVPKGDKANQSFKVPDWIFSSKSLSKEYLKIAFFCEGCFKESENRRPRITINLSKTERFIENGLIFMDILKEMLKYFEINCTKNYVTGKRIRKRDNQLSRDIRFRVNLEDNHKFIKEIGWIK